MKTLVKVLKVEDEITYYNEIDRASGKVMISDFMSTDRFEKALNSNNFGFELVTNNKAKFKLERVNNGKDHNGNLNHYGKTWICIHSNSETALNTLTDMINVEFINNCSLCVEESDHYENGSCISYLIDSEDLYYFKESYKNAKKLVTK